MLKKLLILSIFILFCSFAYADYVLIDDFEDGNISSNLIIHNENETAEETSGYLRLNSTQDAETLQHDVFMTINSSLICDLSTCDFYVSNINITMKKDVGTGEVGGVLVLADGNHMLANYADNESQLKFINGSNKYVITDLGGYDIGGSLNFSYQDVYIWSNGTSQDYIYVNTSVNSTPYIYNISNLNYSSGIYPVFLVSSRDSDGIQDVDTSEMLIEDFYYNGTTNSQLTITNNNLINGTYYSLSNILFDFNFNGTYYNNFTLEINYPNGTLMFNESGNETSYNRTLQNISTDENINVLYGQQYSYIMTIFGTDNNNEQINGTFNYNFSVSNSTLLVHFQFEQNGLDSSGNNNDATYINGTYLTIFPTFNVSGDGSNYSVNITNDDNSYVGIYNHSLETDSICTWYYFPEGDAKTYVLYAETQSTCGNARNHFSLYNFASEPLNFFQDNAGFTYSYDMELNVLNNTWQHICLVENRTRLYGKVDVYLDGEFVGNFSNRNIYDYDEKYIGRRGKNDIPCQYDSRSAIFDNYKIFNGQLTSSEIKSEYEYGDYTFYQEATNETESNNPVIDSVNIIGDSYGDLLEINYSVTNSTNETIYWYVNDILVYNGTDYTQYQEYADYYSIANLFIERYNIPFNYKGRADFVAKTGSYDGNLSVPTASIYSDDGYGDVYDYIQTNVVAYENTKAEFYTLNQDTGSYILVNTSPLSKSSCSYLGYAGYSKWYDGNFNTGIAKKSSNWYNSVASFCPPNSGWIYETGMLWYIEDYKYLNTSFYNANDNVSVIIESCNSNGCTNSSQVNVTISENIIPNTAIVDSPDDNAVNVSVTPTFRVNVTDNDTIIDNVVFKLSDGTTLGTVYNDYYNTITNDSTVELNYTNLLDFSSTYQWYVIVGDGINQTQSPNWNFTTQSQRPVISSTEISGEYIGDILIADYEVSFSDSNTTQWFVNDVNVVNSTTYNTENLSLYDIVKYQLVSVGDGITVAQNSSELNITSEIGNITTPLLDQFLIEGESLGNQTDFTTRYDDGLNYSLNYLNTSLANFTINDTGYITNSTQLVIGSYNITAIGTDKYGFNITDDFKVYVYNSSNTSIIPVYPIVNSPSDEELNVDIIDVNLSVTVFNNNGETMNVTFYLSNGTELGFVSSLTNNTNASILYNFSYGTTYNWYVVIESDGEVEDVTSDYYTFTTQTEQTVLTFNNVTLDSTIIYWDTDNITGNFSANNYTYAEYDWYKNGISLNINSTTLNSSNYDTNDSIIFEVTIFNSTSSNSQNSSSITILSGAEVLNVSISQNTSVHYDQYSVTYNTNHSYADKIQWYVNSAEVTNYQNETTINSSSYNPADNITVVVTATDDNNINTSSLNTSFIVPYDNAIIIPTQTTKVVSAGNNITGTIKIEHLYNQTFSYNISDGFGNPNITIVINNTNLTVTNDSINTTSFTIVVNSSTANGKYYGNITVNRSDGNQNEIIPLTITVATTYGQIQFINETDDWVETLTDEEETITKTFYLNNTGNRILENCTVSIIDTNDNDLSEYIIIGRNNFDVGVAEETSFDLGFKSSVNNKIFRGYPKVSCEATASGDLDVHESGDPEIILATSLPITVTQRGSSAGGARTTVTEFVVLPTNQTFSITTKFNTESYTFTGYAGQTFKEAYGQDLVYKVKNFRDDVITVDLYCEKSNESESICDYINLSTFQVIVPPQKEVSFNITGVIPDTVEEGEVYYFDIAGFSNLPEATDPVKQESSSNEIRIISAERFDNLIKNLSKTLWTWPLYVWMFLSIIIIASSFGVFEGTKLKNRIMPSLRWTIYTFSIVILIPAIFIIIGGLI